MKIPTDDFSKPIYAEDVDNEMPRIRVPVMPVVPIQLQMPPRSQSPMVCETCGHTKDKHSSPNTNNLDRKFDGNGCPIRRAAGYRQFRCPNPDCKSDFTRSDELKRHLQTERCGNWASQVAKSKQPTLAKTSQPRRPKEHICQHYVRNAKTGLDEICGKVYTRKDNFVKHVRSHTHEKPFSCQYKEQNEKTGEWVFCEKSFARGDDRTKHQRNVHKESKQKNKFTGEQELTCAPRHMKLTDIEQDIVDSKNPHAVKLKHERFARKQLAAERREKREKGKRRKHGSSGTMSSSRSVSPDMENRHGWWCHLHAWRRHDHGLTSA